MKTVLIIEDERNLSNIIKKHLKQEGYSVLQEFDGQKGLLTAKQQNPDLIILDIMLPVMDGLEVCKQIRTESTTPILMLTAKTEEIDRIIGLELGADDYLTKPFSIRELLARIKAIFRRIEMVKKQSQLVQTEIIEIQDLYIHTADRVVKVSGRAVDLTVMEFDLLYLLASHPGRVFNRDYLLEHVWGYECTSYERSVDNCILNLRKKLGKDSKAASGIITVWGMGYKFKGGN